jgi:phosphatidate phosphatase APP1
MKPILKLYRGYANEDELIVMGHVFKPTKTVEYAFEKKKFRNAFSMIKLFRIKTQSNTDVYLKHFNKTIHTKTLADGYFKFCIPVDPNSGHGWIDYEVSIMHKQKIIAAVESYIRPESGKLGIISDIDDTFLVSHTMNPLRKIYILLFRNVNSRKIFQDVVSHYQALSNSGRINQEEQNAFFYVSSSEWNLYRFIIKFTSIHKLPKAVILLKDIKTSLTDFFISGSGSHNHKFEKIRHIIEFYPNLKYVLLGDDSQKDPFLYYEICKIFPSHIIAVYIRKTGREEKEKVSIAMKNLKSLDIAACYFTHSYEAIEHSKKIGLIL